MRINIYICMCINIYICMCINIYVWVCVWTCRFRRYVKMTLGKEEKKKKSEEALKAGVGQGMHGFVSLPNNGNAATPGIFCSVLAFHHPSPFVSSIGGRFTVRGAKALAVRR